MGNSRLRPETTTAEKGKPAPIGGTAYLMIYNAVRHQDGLAHGKLHDGNGAHCAIGSFFETNPKAAIGFDLIDEVAMVNDSMPYATMRQRKLHVLRWLRWRLQQVGMPGFERAQAPVA